jgi:hypothetical protein
MTEDNPKDVLNAEEVKAWLAIRKEAGKHIDPETAEVMWQYTQVMDPYSLGVDIPDELQQIGRDYFARAPGSDVWVWFGDLPAETVAALDARPDRGDDTLFSEED